MKFTRESPKTLVFRNALKAPRAERWFFCSSVFLEAGHSGKMGKTRRDTNARMAGRRKQIKESAAEQRCVVNFAWIRFQWVSMNPTIRRYRINRRLCQHPCYCCQIAKFLQNLSFLLRRIFCPPYTIAIASSAWRTFASWLIDVFSFVFRCSRFFELVHVFNVVYVYL